MTGQKISMSKWFRRLRSLLWTAFALVVILAAILVGVGKLLMPYSTRYQPRLEAWLSEQFQRPVALETFTGEWKAFGPRVTMSGLTMLPQEDEQGVVVLERAALDIRPLNFILPGPLYSFQIIGADLSLRRLPDGRYELSGFGINPGSGEGSGLQRLTSVGEVRLRDSKLSFEDIERGIDLQFSQINGRLQMDGQELSTEVSGSLLDSQSTAQDASRVIGDLEVVLKLTLSEDQHLEDAAWHVKTRELQLSSLMDSLPDYPALPESGWLNAELWGGWQLDADLDISGVLDVRETAFEMPAETMRVERLNSRFNWRYAGKGDWQLDLSDLVVDAEAFGWESDSTSIRRDLPNELGLWISTDQVATRFPMALTRKLLNHYQTLWPRQLPQKAEGMATDVDIVLNQRWRVNLVEADVSEFSVAEWDRWPNLNNLDASIRLKGNEGEIRFNSPAMDMYWPRVFSRALQFSVPDCLFNLAWGGPTEAPWWVDVRHCRLENQDMKLAGQLRLSGNQGRPSVNTVATITDGDMSKLDGYWPDGFMHPSAVRWLRRGIVDGDLVDGRVSLTGDLDHWPFRDNEGTFEAIAHVENARLDYADNWPHAEKVNATARFVDASMDVISSSAEIHDVPVKQATAQIRNFKNAVLELGFAADAPMSSMADFIAQSPLQDLINVSLDEFEFLGSASTEAKLDIRLGKQRQFNLQGQLDLAGNGFRMPEFDVVLDDITGQLSYTEKGFEGSGLESVFGGEPAELYVRAGPGEAEVFTAILDGTFPISQVVPKSVAASQAMLGKLDGMTDWRLKVAVDSVEQGTAGETWLQLDSQLTGIPLNLPAPLAKDVTETLPLHIRYPLRSDDPEFTLKLADTFALTAALDQETQNPVSVGIMLGDGSQPLPEAQLPARGEISIDGQAATLNLDGWVAEINQFFNDGGGIGGLKLAPVNLPVANLYFFDRPYEQVMLDLVVDGSTLVMDFDSEQLDGYIRYFESQPGNHSVVAEFERLYLGDPMTEGLAVKTDPRQLPTMHFYAKSFGYGDLELNETRIEAYPEQDGLHFETVQAESPEMVVRARGDWLQTDEGQSSDFDIHMSSESLGGLLKTLGISSAMEGGQTMVEFDASWQGPPSEFALKNLNGELSLNVTHGVILNAQPGAGRLLGLISIQALPRRLALDFRDVFDTGFSFDEASGTFTLDHGTASTENLEMKSPVALISITGSTNLADQYYNQVVSVRPGLGQTLPVIGAIAGGPGGAAAGLALQGLLQKQLGEAAQVQYSIQGPWSEPEVIALEPVAIPQ